MGIFKITDTKNYGIALKANNKGDADRVVDYLVKKGVSAMINRQGPENEKDENCVFLVDIVIPREKK